MKKTITKTFLLILVVLIASQSIVLSIAPGTSHASTFEDLLKNNKEYSKEEIERVNRAMKSLTKSQRKCTDLFFNGFQKKFFAYCIKHNLGKDIGGGCIHLSGALALPVVVHDVMAMESCGVDWKNGPK